MDEMVQEYLTQYLPKNEEWVEELERQAEKDRVPIMDRVGMHFVTQLVQIKQPKKILEIGTAIGYSALRMADASPTTHIVTIEKDEVRYNQALRNIGQLNKEDRIKVIFGDAIDILDQLKIEKELFDLIFIDAAKGQYQHFFEQSIPLLNKNGIIISDNVLFRGYVLNPELSPKRYEKMVQKVRNYNEYLMNHPDFTTSILPIGDGVALSNYMK